MYVAIITTGVLPVPAVRGGAVESLIDNLIVENERFGQLELEIVSIYNEEAKQTSAQYKQTSFVFLKPPRWVLLLDKIIYWTAKNIFKLKKIMSYRYILQRLYYIHSTADLLHTRKYDRIVFENHPTLFMALKRKGNAKRYEGKYDFHLHNEITSDFKCGELIKNCNKVLSVSNFINQSLSEKIKGIAPEKLEVLRNCVDTERFINILDADQKNALKKEYGIQPDEKVIIFSGRLTPEKGIKELLLAFRDVQQKKAKLIIAGGYFFASDTVSHFEKELKMLAEEIKDNVIFTGFIPYQKMQSLYAMADIAVLPSIWEEPAGMTIIESMACGIPVITTDSGGIPEYANEQCAIILKRGSGLIKNLTNSIERLLTDEELRTRMSISAIRAASDLNLENYYTNFTQKI